MTLVMAMVSRAIVKPVDIEAAAVMYLTGLEPLLGCMVSTRRPYGTDWSTAPDELIRVTVVGGGEARDLVLDDAVLAVEVWAPDSERAADLAATTSALLDAWQGMTGDALIYQCQTQRPRSVDDPLTRNPRYLFTASVTARRHVIDTT